MSEKPVILEFSEFFESYLSEKPFIIRGWDEDEEQEFKIEYNEGITTFDNNLKPLDIKNYLFNIGIFPSDEKWWREKAFKKLEKRYNEAIEEEEVPALGLDTNIIINGVFINRLRGLLKRKLKWENPLLLLSLASSHELHYGAESKYNDSFYNKSKLDNIWEFILSLDSQTQELAKTVFGTYKPIENKNILSSLHCKRGRIGLIGSYNYYKHKKLPNTLIIKSIHPYNVAKFDSDGHKYKGIDAIYDTLIAYEFTQFMTFTNTKVTILTMDNSLASLLQNASVDVVYIPPPSKFQLPKEIIIPQRNCSILLRELLVRSPFIVIEDENKKIVLSMIWIGQTDEEKAKGVIHGVVKEKNKTRYLLIKSQ